MATIAFLPLIHKTWKTKYLHIKKRSWLISNKKNLQKHRDNILTFRRYKTQKLDGISWRNQDQIKNTSWCGESRALGYLPIFKEEFTNSGHSPSKKIESTVCLECNVYALKSYS